MSLLSNKRIKIGILIVFAVAIFLIVPSPINQLPGKDKYSLENNQWHFVLEKKGTFSKYYNQYYPIYIPYMDVYWSGNSRDPSYSNVIVIHTDLNSKSYIVTSFYLPRGKSTFSYYSNGYNDTVMISDSKNVIHNPTKITNSKYDFSAYGGQNIKIMISPNAPPETHVYSMMTINFVPSTIEDGLGFVYEGLVYIFWLSLIISSILSFSGLQIFTNLIKTIQDYVENSIIYEKDAKFISKVRGILFFILYKILNLVDSRIDNPKWCMFIKTFLIICLSTVFIYFANIVIYIIVVIIIALIIVGLIVSFILYCLGAGLGIGGGGGGSSSGSGGGSSSSSSGAIFGSSYEEAAEKESRPFKVDKETRSSEGAFPLGLGGDTIYKTEYEDTSTGETVKGYGWNRSEADFNARKNLKKK